MVGRQATPAVEEGRVGLDVLEAGGIGNLDLDCVVPAQLHLWPWRGGAGAKRGSVSKQLALRTYLESEHREGKRETPGSLRGGG